MNGLHAVFCQISRVNSQHLLPHVHQKGPSFSIVAKTFHQSLEKGKDLGAGWGWVTRFCF
jgi:hypothetical protein